MPVPSSISDLSTTAGSNYPPGSESPSTIDDYLRAHASFLAQLRDGKGANAEATIASAATVDIGAASSPFVKITGTTTITSFGTNYNGPRYLRFESALTLTHNATTLILPGGVNIAVAAGDTCIVVPNGNPATGWRVSRGIIGSELAASSGASLVGGGARFVSSIAELRTLLKTSPSSKAFVTGYYEPGDGGGGAYYYDAADTISDDNGGTIIVANDGGRWKLVLTGGVSVKQFGARGDSSTDDTTAIQNAINAMSSYGGVVYVPTGQYKTTATILMSSGVSLIGDGYWKGSDASLEGVTSILATHTGAAMLSLKGAIGCTVRNISLQGSQTAKPKTGLLLGRSSADSAGFHEISRVSITGWYTIAAIYTIASEDNLFKDILCWNFGGDAAYGLVSSTQDVFAVDGLTTSTNLTNTFIQLKIINTSPLSSAAGIYLECALEMGSFNFIGCYLTQYAGAYVRVNNGAIDGVGMFGPLTFIGTSGEPLSGGDPTVGIDLTAAVPVELKGLTVLGSRFQLAAGATHYDIRQSANVSLLNPNIVIQPPEASPYATSEILFAKVKGGIVSVGRKYEWQNVTFTSAWSNLFGVPYAGAGYRVNQCGEVELRGVVVRSAAGFDTIFTLPTDLKPNKDLVFSVYAGGALGKIRVSSTTGEVMFVSGSHTEVNLNGIRFNLT